jgi:N-acetyltransferase 10
MLSKTVVKARPSVLWCYKNDLYLSSHRKKRMRQIQKMAQRGLLDPEKEDPFSLFVASTNIRYCFYSETHKILGSTYGMLVLQDFEALTPNLLARTIETVEGGGIVVMLLSSLDSLTKLYSLTMDVHSRFRTESHQNVVPRFNERLVLSLAGCHSCILMDDELNILPTSTHVRLIQPIPTNPDGTPVVPSANAAANAELKDLTESLREVQPAGALVSRCRTLDQARAVVSFLDAASEKTLRSTVALTAARGRGKSAALGLAIAGALGLGYSNIFVTAPSPENLRTLFEFVFKGLDELGYKEHIDYDLVESTNPAFAKAVVRVNVYRTHRQTVQYIQPQHHAALAQAELLVIDEAAAIPLPLVKSMLGPYLVFLCSTVNGYEGTGRSLSLKLIQQLRTQGAQLTSGGSKGAEDAAAAAGNSGSTARTFREIILQEPIRYSLGDPVERWLNDLLCLDAAEHTPPLPSRLPHPDECDLYYVERDTLFSGHKASEAFLQRCMALYVASHYRNTPNDLLLLADAPAHHIFALLGPVGEGSGALPDVLAVVQVALEGEISKKSATASLAAGQLPQGDLIPWTVGQQFQDSEFPSLSGARIVRIATHPDLMRAGYGTRALDVLRRYFEGDIADVLDEEAEAGGAPATKNGAANGAGLTGTTGGGLLAEQIKPRAALPPLLTNLADRPAERLHYLGTSFGLTQSLLSYWRKNGYAPVYLRQTPSDVTGEHTIIMLRTLHSPDVADPSWLEPFVSDFRTRFTSLLAGSFRDFGPALALSILDPKLRYNEEEAAAATAAGGGGGGASGSKTSQRVIRADGHPLNAYDMKRLQAYSSNLVDHHLILDLISPLARAYFSGNIPVTLSYSQAAILLCLGLQQQDVSAVERALDLPSSQVLALFSKAVRRLYQQLRAVKEAEVERQLPKPKIVELNPHEVELDAELEQGAEDIRQAMRDALRPEDLMEQYAIRGAAEDFEAVAVGKKLKSGGLLSVPSKDGKKKKDQQLQQYQKTPGSSKGKGTPGSSNGKKDYLLSKKKDGKREGTGGEKRDKKKSKQQR